MVMQYTPTNISAVPPPLRPITQEKFDKGVISIVGAANLPLNALVNADNIFLDEDARPTLRPGNDWYGTAISGSTIDGAATFVDQAETVHLIVIAGGTVYRSFDNGDSWQACTGGSFTPGKHVGSEQAGNILNLFNGVDIAIGYDGSLALVSHQGLLKPESPQASKTGLAGTTLNTLTYYLSAVNDVGYTDSSTVTFDGFSNTVTVDRDRASFDDSNFVSLQWNKGLVDANGDGVINTADTDLMNLHLSDNTFAYPVRYDLFVSTNGAAAQYLDSIDVSGVANLDLVQYLDKGQLPTNSAVLVPTDNTTTGLEVGDMASVDTRLYATRDFRFPWRVWISGEGNNVGKFSNAFGATYIDLQKGSQFRPIKVEGYQDGKANPLATVWCNSLDGLGCVWQGTLDTFTVGDTSFAVPNFSKLPGSRGTSAQYSVVNVLNDYYYYNSQAIFNIGPRAQFNNLLSTDEASANIRKDVRSIRVRASNDIAAYFFEAKVYMSVPWNADVNNRIIIYDTERKAWLPKAFDFGVNGFFQYPDTNGIIHLLCWKPGDTRLTEISQSIHGSYGEGFHTDLLTGLVHANVKNRMDFMFVEEAEFEMSDLAGTVNIELIGLTQENGFGTIDSKIISSESTTPVGWTTGRWTKHAWTHGSRNAIVNYSEPTTKRFFSIGTDVNCYQWHITTDTADSDYLLRTLQVSGTASQTGKPPAWEIL